MSTENINSIVNEYFELQQTIETLTKRQDAIKNQIQDTMLNNNSLVINGDGWRATLTETKTNRFDTAAFKKVHMDLYTAFCKVASGTRFTLNHIKTA